MYYIGVDLGTSAVKLLLMEGSGKICNIVSKNIRCSSPIRVGLSRILRTGSPRAWKGSKSSQKGLTAKK